MKTIDLDNTSIKKDEKNGLGREGFSKHLFELIRCIDSSSGAVVGLEGAWGSGKTTVLNSLRKHAKDSNPNDQPIFIEFNPWMMSGTNSLVEAMLLEFLSALPISTSTDTDEKTQNLIGRTLDFLKVLKIGKYAGPLANCFIPGLGLVIDGVVQFATEAEDGVKKLKEEVEVIKKDKNIPSLWERKKAVVELLRNWPHRFVMILDDVDRLPPNEVASIIQAVKAVADFPNVIYVLAYDPTVMAHAIEVALQIEDGLSYLEKIIQLPVKLPKVRQAKFNSHTVERLSSIISTDDRIAIREMGDVERVWSLVPSLLKTPREVERLRTRLQVIIPILIREVNLADVILLEAMDLVHPEIIKWIGDESKNLICGNPASWENFVEVYDEEYIYKWRVHPDERGEDNEEKIDARIVIMKNLKESWQREVSDKNRWHLINEILNFLFSQSNRLTICRIQTYKFWDHWLCCHDRNGRWSFKDVEKYVANPMKIIYDKVHLDKNSFFQLMGDIRDLYVEGLRVSNLRASNSSEMVDVFVQFVHAEDGNENEYGLNAIDSVLMSALGCCINLDVDRGLDVLRGVVKNRSVWFSHNLILELLPSGDSFMEEDFDGESLVRSYHPIKLMGESFEPILALWVSKVKEEFSKEVWDFQGWEHSPYKLIEWLPSFGKNEIAVELSKAFLQNKSSRLDAMFQGLNTSKFRDGSQFINSFQLDNCQLENSFQLKYVVRRSVLPDTEYLIPLIKESKLFKGCNVSDQEINFPIISPIRTLPKLPPRK